MDNEKKRGRGRPSRTGLKRLRHCIYDINYHIIFVTKYRRPVITAEILALISEQTAGIAEKWGCQLLELNGEADHVHLLLSAPPNFNLSHLIGNIKTITSRTVRHRFKEHVRKYYWKPFFWTPSYCILSTGQANLEIVRKYVESQAGCA
jgi:putative transposase